MIRVTELLRWGGIAPPIPDSSFVAEALKRGTAVHEWSLKVEASSSAINDMPSELRGYGKAVADFHKAFNPTWKLREKRLDDLTLDITGCPDRFGVIEDELTLLDYKTGKPYDWHKMQLAVYAILLSRYFHKASKQFSLNNIRRMCVYLSVDGTFTVQRYDSKIDLIRGWELISSWLSHNKATDALH